MGACCCKKEIDIQETPYESTITFNGIQIVFKRGIPSKEVADVFVMSTDNYINNRSTTIVVEENILQSINSEIKKSRGENEEPLSNGEVIFSDSGLLSNFKEIAHLAVPVWKGGSLNEEKKITNGFLEILKQSEIKNMNTVMFTDITSGRFGIPKQVGINSLINAIKVFQTQEKTTDNITTILFVHRIKSTVILFEEFFKKDMGEREKSEDSVYSDHLKIAYTPDANQYQIETNIGDSSGGVSDENKIKQEQLEDEIAHQLIE